MNTQTTIDRLAPYIGCGALSAGAISILTSTTAHEGLFMLAAAIIGPAVLALTRKR